MMLESIHLIPHRYEALGDDRLCAIVHDRLVRAGAMALTTSKSA